MEIMLRVSFLKSNSWFNVNDANNTWRITREDNKFQFWKTVLIRKPYLSRNGVNILAGILLTKNQKV